ncbi:ammonium transporter [[Leptolyngbya] sp. PCC 7376]|uniref:ammonium transporter n=1 Tax=[Leptolyngbya] sp. PCC 7376 TaxID=111781 RepID=UPI0002FA4CA0|nr:ammonium transporter [[Leptolyngbya] sp. PCC 7376]
MIDIQWLLLCSGLVFLMQPGFMCLESGLTRSKNNINVALKNLIDFGLSIALFWIFGFGLMFGTSIFGLLGGNGFVIDVDRESLLAAFFFFEAMFCSTSATIVSGAVAERLKFEGYLLIVVLSSSVIYPLFGHWVWNGIFSGTKVGWLERLGYIDFAGSSVVHGVGAGIALAAVIVIGARQGRFDEQGRSHKIQGSSLPLSMLGIMLLWLGWLGFNAGSTLVLNDQVPLIMVHTILGGVGGMLMGCVVSWRRHRLPAVETVMNGTLAGLVGVTAGCHAINTSQSFFIGMIATLAMVMVEDYLEYRQIDDTVGAIAVHGGAGIWGIIAVALFADPVLLDTGLNRLSQLAVQALGAGVCFLWSFGATWVILKWVNSFFPLRVSFEDEKIGLNISEHSAHNDFYDLSLAIAHQAQTEDLDERLTIEPFTEAGLIALQYNQLIEALSVSTRSLQETNEELAIAKDKAEAANIAKSMFLTNVSHELRTPLNGILGVTQLLENSPNLDPQELDNVSLLHQSGSHLLELINDILDLSKIEAGKLELAPNAFAFSTFLLDIINLVGASAEQKGLTFSSKLDPDLPQTVVADALRLKQVILNLLGNAIKFTEQGSVQFEVKLLRRQQANESSVVKLLFCVKDTGVGLEPDKLSKLFKPFEQAGDREKNAEGTGLGLSISQKLLKIMGSEIKVKSVFQEGSEFSFELELLENLTTKKSKVTASPTKLDLQTPLGEQHPLRILVAEDNRINQTIIRQLLKRLGYEMTLAQNGLEALECLENERYDVILMDLLMPQMGGLEAARNICEKYSPGDRPRMIALSANAMSEHIAEAYQAGMDDFVSKPIKVELLIEALLKCAPQTSES